MVVVDMLVVVMSMRLMSQRVVGCWLSEFEDRIEAWRKDQTDSW
jgi:hypothetical protein